MRVYFDKEKTRYPKGGKLDDIVYCYHNEGNICIGRKYYEVPMMKQHEQIIKMEKIGLEIWKQLPERVKHDFLMYAKLYIVEYPKLRRKFLNSYSIFLKVIHKLESEFQISRRQDVGFALYKSLFGIYSVYDFIRLGFLLPVKFAYKLRAKVLSYFCKTDDIYQAILLNDNDLLDNFTAKKAYG